MHYTEAAVAAGSCELCLLTSKITGRYASRIDPLRETIIMAANKKIPSDSLIELSEDSNTVSGAKGQLC